MIVDAAHYIRGRRVELPDTWEAPHEQGFTWIGLFEPNPAEFDGIRQSLGLHELAVEDATDANQRPKLEIYGDSMFIAMRTASTDPNTDEMAFGELQIFIAAKSIVVVRHGEVSDLTEVRAALETEPETLAAGPMAVLQAIIDNLTRLVDRAETYRELITTVFQANLTQVSVRLAEVGVQQNEDMRRISAWVAIAASPTIIAGIYGMNFRNMPEFDWAFGYPMALTLMAASSLGLYIMFRRADWL